MHSILHQHQPNQANVAKDMLFTWAATCLTRGPGNVPRLRDLAKAAIPADQLVNMAADPATLRGWIAHAPLSSTAQVRATSLPDHQNYFRLGLYCQSVEADKRTFALVYHDQQNRGVGSAQYVKMLRTKLVKHWRKVSTERTHRAITNGQLRIGSNKTAADSMKRRSSKTEDFNCIKPCRLLGPLMPTVFYLTRY